MNELNIRITGEAGQGIETIGVALARLFKDDGLYLFCHRDYMSRIRGGNNFIQLRISSQQVNSPREKVDIILCLDPASADIHRKDLAEGGIILGEKERLLNTAGLGMLAGITARPFAAVEKIIRDTFADKGSEVVDKNIQAARSGFDSACKSGQACPKLPPAGKPPASPTMLITAHDSLTLGAIKAGCKFYSGYPMTPSTTILELMSHYAKQYNIIVEQAEDEIAAINMIIGASFAGVRAMTSTSGGGFDLMTEGLSLAGMTETPVVICLGMRPGPATGFPTRSAQGELDLAISAGHGEFARAVYAPGSIEEAFKIAVRAFNTAEKFQVPAIILTDTFLADNTMNLTTLDTGSEKVERFIISKKDSSQVSDYKRYQLTATGISPRAVPSWIKDVVYADSDEHTELGHISESAADGKAMTEKRLTLKMQGLAKEVMEPVSENVKGADTVLVGFGSNLGVLKDCVSQLQEQIEGKTVGFVHLPQVWPFPAEQVKRLLAGIKNVYTVENNASGQLSGLIARETGIKPTGSFLKYDGRPFSLDELVDAVRNRLQSNGL